MRNNLSTRPFYNEGAVKQLFIAAAVLLAVATAVNLTRVVSLSRDDTSMAVQATQNEARAAELRATAARLKSGVDTKQLERASTEARQANDLIDRRTFSWTELFNRFEATMPDNVRITSVRPKVDPKRGTLLTVTVVARSVEDIDELMQKLEATGAFTELLTPEEHMDEQGLLEASLEARYTPAVGHNDARGVSRR